MTVTAEAIEKRLAEGLRNLWYPVLPCKDLSSKPLSIVRCGFRIVLWRDTEGRAYALEDRCPHRAAPLSQGIILGDRIACGYHGVQVDQHGVAVSVPGSPGCKLEGMRTTRAFPVQERAGAIFLFMGETADTPPPPLGLPPELESDQWSHFLCYVEWQGDYRYVYDNVMDPMHGMYLHRQSHSMSFGESQASFRVKETELGFIFEKEGQRDVNFDWTEFEDRNAFWLNLEIPYPKTGGPGGNFRINSIYTPMQTGWTALFFWRLRRVTGWQRDAWRFLYKNRLEQRHWHVLEQDRVMLEQMADDAREHEILYQHDMGLVRLRRLFKQRAEAQLAANSGSPCA